MLVLGVESGGDSVVVLCGVGLQLADRERDNCWREMSSSNTR